MSIGVADIMPSSAERSICVGTVVRRDSRVLMVRQTPSHSLGPVWTIPWGVAQAGESPTLAASRETLEESGVTIDIVGLIGMQELPDPWAGTLALIFLGRHVAGEPKPDGVETDAASYMTLDELRLSNDRFEPWSHWLVQAVLAGSDFCLLPMIGNPFHPSSGYFAQAPSQSHEHRRER